MRDDETDTDAPAGPEPRSRGRPPARPLRGAGSGELDAGTRRRLGRALRAHYADLLSAPVPDRFAALIAGLDAGIAPAAGPSAGSSADDPGQEDAR
ncbi:NepR family anti-sigma factor [Methylobacterium tarhaniae]|uniref:NepR family anti-sigma factor n=1 Tax=Methylobacterium tarhaniae TaxID=1187852 RepID=UPI003D055AEF